jgi:aldose sugar dehydrogenase
MNHLFYYLTHNPLNKAQKTRLIGRTIAKMLAVKMSVRRLTLTGMALLALGLLSACESSKKSTSIPSASPDPVVGAPVQTPPPNAENQKPAFTNQTRAPEVSSNAVPRVTVITTGLDKPWSISFLPDGRLLISERPGKLRIVSQTGERGASIDVPSILFKGQGGLLDVALAPDFNKSRLIYWSFAEERDLGRNGTSVARGKLSADEKSLENVEVLFRQMPAWSSDLHFGSRLVWDRGGLLYVTLGERSVTESRILAQDTNTHLGKVVRINADGFSPNDNPFFNGGGAKEVWSYGHRNVQGAALHPETGELWTIEHGPRGGDELNQPQAGKNYGWPVITYGEEYSGAPVGAGITQKDGMEQPIYYWDPVIAPSNMIFYTGDMFEEWQGNLLIGAMNPGALVRLVLDGKKVIGEQRLVPDAGRVRDVAQGEDGAVWLITDQGRLLKLTL